MSILPGHRAGRQAGRRAVTVAALLLLIAGCGQSEPAGQAAPTEPEPQATQPEPEPQATEPEPTLVEVDVFLVNDRLGDPCGEVFPVARAVDAEDPPAGAVQALLAGPTQAEETEAYGGWFSEKTAGMLRGMHVDGGVARVDFEDLAAVIPNASTACGSAALLAQLDTTLLQFPDVAETVYSIDGDAGAFYEWLQLAWP